MRQKMKAITTLLLCLLLLAGAVAPLTGCGEGKHPQGDAATTIVCTSFASFDFARSLLASYTENGGVGAVQLTLLGTPGQDMHSYEPTAKDIITLASADVIIYTGMESWLNAALSSAGNTSAIRVSMMETCDVPAADHDHAHDHEHDHDHGDDACTLIGEDEHVWLSVENAIRITRGIADALKQADEANAAAWESCAIRYMALLADLRVAYATAMETVSRKTLVLADRNPFAYLFRELGIECVAAFPGCSSETSASFETQMKLIEHTKTHELPYIFVMEGSDEKVAGVVAAETGAGILTLHSLQVVTDTENTTYLTVMKNNLENLKKALQ